MDDLDTLRRVAMSDSLNPKTLLLFAETERNIILNFLFEFKTLTKDEFLSYLKVIFDLSSFESGDPEEEVWSYLILQSSVTKIASEDVFGEGIYFFRENVIKKIFEVSNISESVYIPIVNNFEYTPLVKNLETKEDIINFLSKKGETEVVKYYSLSQIHPIVLKSCIRLGINLNKYISSLYPKDKEVRYTLKDLTTVLLYDEKIFTEEEYASFSKLLPENTKDKEVVRFISTFEVLDLFLGPQNPIIGKECAHIKPDGKHSSRCRMIDCECFTTTLYEEDGEENYPFDYCCEECEKIIPDISQAIRYPKKHGGFSGWYCSKRCLFDSKLTEGNKNRLEFFMEYLSRINIVDRRQEIGM